MKKLLLTVILFVVSFLIFQKASAQYVVKEADAQYNLFNYSKAANLYQEAYKKKPTLHAAENLATCYRQMRDFVKAETWYAKATAYDGCNPDDFLYYAEILKSNSKFDEAKSQYTKYYTLAEDIDLDQLNFWISSCDSCKNWLKNPGPFVVKNEKSLNSAQSDWGTAFYKNSLIFASDRSYKNLKTESKHPFLFFDAGEVPSKKIYGWTGNNYYRIYERPTGMGKDSVIKLFPLLAGTDYHIGTASFTKDGNEMFFTLTRLPEKWKKDTAKIVTINLEIFSSKIDPKKHQWSKPVAFKYNNVEKWSVGDPFITPDGQCLYFVSDMPGGLGGTDIYYCLRDEKGNWKPAINLVAVNSPGNERTPVIDSAQNLYFASDDGVGMGGLDIYKAVLKDCNLVSKQNMGYPINSPYDDFALMTTNGKTGFFSSNRNGGLGSDDIYSFKGDVKKASPFSGLYRLEGIAYEKNTTRPLANTAILLSNIVNGNPAKVTTDATGKYSFPLSEKSDYKLRGEQPGYLSDNQEVTTRGLSKPQTIKKDLYLDKIVLNKAIRIENIYYDFDKSYIRPDAAVELDKLIKILIDNPTIHIELGSHTDSRGNDAYNMALSQRRAEAAVAYIVNKGGIDHYRIYARGYGETQLLNRCANGVKCSPAEHQLNRRTEFKITSM